MTLFTIFIQFLLSMGAAVSFSVLYSVPGAQLLFCGLIGAFGWIVYLVCSAEGIGMVLSYIIATFALTVLTRCISAVRSTPVTVYMSAGILPLVPGAGIYYTSYYFIMNQMQECYAYGMETVMTAGAIALGIALGFALPQVWFNALRRFRIFSPGR